MIYVPFITIAIFLTKNMVTMPFTIAIFSGRKWFDVVGFIYVPFMVTVAI
jgi:hypothetical protein